MSPEASEYEADEATYDLDAVVLHAELAQDGAGPLAVPARERDVTRATEELTASADDVPAGIDSAADAEWLAMTELGDLKPPNTDQHTHLPKWAAPAPSVRGERPTSERGVAVVPPAEAWPDDVWAETPVAGSERRVSGAVDRPHPVTLGDDVIQHSEDDATLGAISADPALTAYPPGVPDTLDAYALDGTPEALSAPSAVYQPETTQGWAGSGYGAMADARHTGDDANDSPALPVGRIQPGAGSAAEGNRADQSPLAARLRLLADELDAGSLAAGSDTAGMRDSEAIVAVLGALLRAHR